MTPAQSQLARILTDSTPLIDVSSYNNMMVVGIEGLGVLQADLTWSVGSNGEINYHLIDL